MRDACLPPAVARCCAGLLRLISYAVNFVAVRVPRGNQRCPPGYALTLIAFVQHLSHLRWALTISAICSECVSCAIVFVVLAILAPSAQC